MSSDYPHFSIAGLSLVRFWVMPASSLPDVQDIVLGISEGRDFSQREAQWCLSCSGVLVKGFGL